MLTHRILIFVKQRSAACMIINYTLQNAIFMLKADQDLSKIKREYNKLEDG